MVLVDSNVLIDLFTGDPDWADWSTDRFIEQAAKDTLCLNPIIYAEISIAFTTVKKLETALEPLQILRRELPFEAAFIAGKAFLDYKRAGGEKRSPLPDFYIGAHAACSQFPLLTRDAKRYRTYFPGIQLISP